MTSLSVSDIKTLSFGMAGAALLGAALLLLVDPTAEDQARLTTINDGLKRLPKPAQVAQAQALDTSVMLQTPIFIMSTGPTAYKEAGVRLLGVAISPGRKAALVSIDGGPEQWMRVNELQGDIRLLEVGPRSVRFDTPVGIRTVDFSAEATAQAANN